ncbi:MAG: RNA methyltransferase [Gemmatimonadetes bacterium]|nr:RNA methyltransferase [Gemmatimonadota bacterium]
MNRISKSRQRLVRRLDSRRAREREGLAMVEGPRVILEALWSAVDVRWVLVGEDYSAGQPGRAIVSGCAGRGVETGFVRDEDVRDLCTSDAPVPVLACVRPPPLEKRPLERGRYLMAIGVQIPGNLGTLIRSAWGFGLDGVVIGRGTVDPWNAKVVRASAGAVFHVPLIAPGGVGSATVLHADTEGAPVDTVEEASARNWVLVVGNEVRGIPLSEENPGRAISVPQAEGVDSLNVAVAGSILMYVLTRPGRGA